MSRVNLERLAAEWRASRRLRLIVLIVLVVVAGHGLSALAARTDADRQRYASDLELQLRLEGLRGPNLWAPRADEAEAALEAANGRVPEVSSAGSAQAELQAWMTALAAGTGIPDARIRVEDTLDVPGHPGLWQVLGRIDGQIPQYGHGTFLRALSEGLPWIQADRIEIGDGTPARLSLVVRGYYRRAEASPDDAAPGDASGSGTSPVPAPAFDDSAMPVQEPRMDPVPEIRMESVP